MEVREKRWHSGSFEMEEIEFKNAYQAHGLILLSKGKNGVMVGNEVNWSRTEIIDRRDEWEGFWAAESIHVRFQNDVQLVESVGGTVSLN